MASDRTYHGQGIFSKVRKEDGKTIYYILYLWQGRRLTEKIGPTLDRARSELAARRHLIDTEPAYLPPPIKNAAKKAAEKSASEVLTFEEFTKVFDRDWASRRKSKRFFDHLIRRLNLEFGKYQLDQITTRDIDAYLARLAKTRKPGTVNHHTRFLKNLFRRAVEWKYVTENPAEPVRQVKEPPPKERYFSREETDALLRFAPDHLRPIIQTALLTGMRQGEILALTWDRVSLDRRMIHLRETKSGKARWIPIGDDLLAVLKALPRHLKTQNVFTYLGNPLASVKTSWETTRDLAKVDGRFHDLRHTWASRAVMAGMDLWTVKELGGWADFAMVQRYAHFAPEAKVKAAQLLNGTAQVAVVVAGQ